MGLGPRNRNQAHKLISKRISRPVYCETDNPITRQQGREAQENEPGKSQPDRDVGLDAERIVVRTRPRAPQRPGERRAGRSRRERHVGENLIVAEIEPDLDRFREDGGDSGNFPDGSSDFEERIRRHNSARNRHKSECAEFVPTRGTG